MAMFNVGDRVRVRPYTEMIMFESLKPGASVYGICQSTWCRMQEREYVVKSVEALEDGRFIYRLDGDGMGLSWPAWALERAEDAESECGEDSREDLVEPGPLDLDILGAAYRIYERPKDSDPILADCDGYTDWTSKTIVVQSDMSGTLGDLGKYRQKVLRHEITHAFLFESGLAECAHTESSGAFNEQLVDWIAWQGPKLIEAWKKAGCLDR